MKNDSQHALVMVVGVISLFSGMFALVQSGQNPVIVLGLALFVLSIFIWIESIGLRIRDDILDELIKEE